MRFQIAISYAIALCMVIVAEKDTETTYVTEERVEFKTNQKRHLKITKNEEKRDNSKPDFIDATTKNVQNNAALKTDSRDSDLKKNLTTDIDNLAIHVQFANDLTTDVSSFGNDEGNGVLIKSDDLKNDDKTALINKLKLKTASIKIYDTKVDKLLKNDSDNANMFYRLNVKTVGPRINEEGLQSENSQDKKKLLSNISTEALSMTKKKRVVKNDTPATNAALASSMKFQSVASSEDDSLDEVSLFQNVYQIFSTSSRQSITANDENETPSRNRIIPDNVSFDSKNDNRKVCDKTKLNALTDSHKILLKVTIVNNDQNTGKVLLLERIRTAISESRQTEVNIGDKQDESAVSNGTNFGLLAKHDSKSLKTIDNSKKLFNEAKLNDLFKNLNETFLNVTDHDFFANLSDKNIAGVNRSLFQEHLVNNFHTNSKQLPNNVKLNEFINDGVNKSDEMEHLDSFEKDLDNKPINIVVVSIQNKSCNDLNEDIIKEDIKDIYGLFQEADSNETNVVPEKNVLSNLFKIKFESTKSAEVGENTTQPFDKCIFVSVHVFDENKYDELTEAAQLINVTSSNTMKLHLNLPVVDSAQFIDDGAVKTFPNVNISNTSFETLIVKDSNFDDVATHSDVQKIKKNVDTEAFFTKRENPYVVKSEEINTLRVVDHRVVLASVENNFSDYDVLDNLRDDVDKAYKNLEAQQSDIPQNRFIHRSVYRYFASSDANTKGAGVTKETQNQRQVTVSDSKTASIEADQATETFEKR